MPRPAQGLNTTNNIYIQPQVQQLLPRMKNPGCANGRNGVYFHCLMPAPAPEPLDDLNEIPCLLLNISVLQCSAARDLEYDTIDI